MLLCCGFFFRSIGFAQPELVMNGSFEGMIPDSCPFFNEPNFYWNYGAGSPDLFAACYPINSFYNAPYARWGYQEPRSGENYIGLQTFGPQGVVLPCGLREVAWSKLFKPLEKGSSYCVRFYVSLADTNPTACNHIGAYFARFPHLYGNSQPQLCQVIAQVENDAQQNPLTNTAGWTLVMGRFVAQGNEEYIHLGNFRPNQTSDTTNLIFPISQHPLAGQSYYYIDDVSVIEERAFTRHDTLVCSMQDFPFSLSAFAGAEAYLWSQGDTSRSILVNAPGTYHIQMKSPCG